MHWIRLYGLDTHTLTCQCVKGANCGSPGKHPRDAAWQQAPPLSDAEADAWRKRGGNLGWRMGRQPDGRVLVCLDEDEPGAIEAACLELGDLPETLTQVTGSGGIHLIYEWPAGTPSPRNSVRALPGLDVRSEGGQIVVEPSLHASGNRYRWADAREPAPLPDAWVARLAGVAPRATQVAGAKPIEREWPISEVVELLADTYAAGGRHEIIRALASYLARRGWDTDSICDVARGLPSNQVDARVYQARQAAEQARMPGTVTIGWEALERRLGSGLAERLAQTARHPEEPADWWAAGVGWSEWWARVLPRLERRQAEAQRQSPRLVLHDCRVYIRQDDGSYNAHKPVRKDDLLVALKPYGWDTRDARGRQLPAPQVLQDWAEHAVDIEHRFDARGVTWDADRRILVHGYTPPAITPLHDADVAAWFAGLFGEGLEAVHRWIAACAPEHTRSRLTACLVLIGAKGVGKSTLPIALAQMWGCTAPVKLRDACARFNGPAAECPIILDDECAFLGKGEMTSQEFLETIQARERKVEFKGQEKFALFGCQRVIVTANDAGNLRFRKIRGVRSIEASADRMSWHDSIDERACYEALERLRPRGQHDIDLARVRGHVAWIQANTRLTSEERFVGAWGRDAARAEIQADAEDQFAAIYDALRRAADGESWGSVIQRDDASGTLLVHAPGLVKALAVDGERVSQADVHRVLRPLRGKRALEMRRVGAGVARLWPVPIEALT